ncbi:hypothetical protein D3C86_1974230 [compost metagenome]
MASTVLARSQELVNLALPTGSNWNEHWSGSAITVTGFFACAANTSGLPYWVSAWKIGK